MSLTDPNTLQNRNAPNFTNTALPLALQIGSLGMALNQASQARKRLNAVRMPSAPPPTRNPLLQRRIAQAQQEAELGTGVLRREREASTARAMEQGRQVASQMGGATYGAMMQNQALAGDRFRRQGLVEDEGLRMKRQGQLDNLIGADMQQDARADQMAMQDYQNQFNMQNQIRQMEEFNLLAGRNNAMQTFGALGADLPTYAQRYLAMRNAANTTAPLTTMPQTNRVATQLPMNTQFGQPFRPSLVPISNAPRPQQ